MHLKTLQDLDLTPFNYFGFTYNKKESGIAKNKAFSRISVGLLINNDYLVFSSFQISLSYPKIPLV
jgi:hypothetical protein